MAPDATVFERAKKWELDWASIGAVIFAFAPKIRFFGRVLGTLGDALRWTMISPTIGLFSHDDVIHVRVNLK